MESLGSGPPIDYPDIASAVAVATSGDRILIVDGIYTGTSNTNINSGGLDITIQSQSEDPDGFKLFTIDCNYNVLGGL